MKENEFLDGVSNIEPDVVERFVSMDNKLQNKASKLKSKGIWLRFGAVAACILLIISVIVVEPLLEEFIPGLFKQYKRISFNDDSLGLQNIEYIDSNTKVVDNITNKVTDTEFPVYKITKRNISKKEFQKMLKNLNIDNYSEVFDHKGNKIVGSLVSYTDTSRGYFKMTDDELEKMAWEVFEKLPFIDGTYEYFGIKSTTTLIDSEGEHITRVGVSFRRTIDNIKVIGNDRVFLYFDGSGLVELSIELYDYKKIDTFDMVPLDVALSSIKNPDSIVFDEKLKQITAHIDTLQVKNSSIIFYNQYSRGCKILQPVYDFSGSAIDSDGNQTAFNARIIAIPDKYTYE